MGSGTRSIRKGAGDPARRNQDPGRTDPDPGRHLAGLAAVLRDSPVHRSVPRPADRRQDRDARTDRAGRQEPWPQSTLLAAIPHLPRAPGAWELRFLLRPDAAGVTDPVVGHACHSIPRAGRSGDVAGRAIAILGMSIPVFWLAPVISYLFGYQPTQGRLLGLPILPSGTRLFPIAGYVDFGQSPVQWAYHLILPWITLAIGFTAVYIRFIRTLTAEQLAEDYTRTARAKGASTKRVLVRH